MENLGMTPNLPLQVNGRKWRVVLASKNSNRSMEGSQKSPKSMCSINSNLFVKVAKPALLWTRATRRHTGPGQHGGTRMPVGHVARGGNV